MDFVDSALNLDAHRQTSLASAYHTPPPVSRYKKGQVIFDRLGQEGMLYRVETGEVAILRNGWPIDLVETGEALDGRVWGDAKAVAWRDCVLSIMTF